MTINQYHRTFSFITAFFVLALGFLLFLQISTDRQLEINQRLHVKALTLSNELSQRSGVLTRTARDYVMTGDTNSLAQYHKVLAVKNGKMPRADGNTISFRTILDGLGLTKNEKDLLNLGDKRSNDLAKIEIKAFQIYQKTNEKLNKKLAHELLFGSTYMSSVAQIKNPIEQFNNLLHIRIAKRIKANQRSKEFYFYWFYLILFLFFILIISFVFIIQKKVVNPLIKGLEVSCKIQDGNYDNRWTLDESNEIGELAQSFNAMLDAIATNKKDLDQSMVSALTLNAQLTSQNIALEQTAIVSVTDVKGNILRANELFSKVSQYPMEEIVGANHRIVNSGYHDKETWKEMYHELANGRTWRKDIKNKAKDGSYYWVDSIMVPVYFDSDKPQEYLAVRFLITERKEAEKELENSKQQLQSIFDTLPVGMVMMNKEGETVAANEITENILGISADKQRMRALQSEKWEIINEDGDEMKVEDYPASRVLAGESIVNNVIMGINRPNDSLVWINVNAAHIGDTNGGVVLAFEDVTERRKTLEELELSEEQFSTIVANVPGIIFRCLIDEHWTMLFISEQVELISGYPAASFMKNKERSYADLIVPEDLQKVQDTVAEKIKLKEKYAVEYRIIRADGQERWVKSQGQAVFDENDEIKWLDGAIIDITDQKRAEQEIFKISMLSDNALELTKAGFWHVDFSEENIFHSSDRATEIFGLEKAKNNQYLITDWFDNVVKGDSKISEFVGEQFSGTIEGKYKMYDVEYPFYRPVNNDVIWLRAVGQVVRDNTGKALRMYGVVQNIHDSKLNQLALAEAMKEAEVATEAKSSFLANMSHEIRTPMNAVIGFSHLIQKTELNEKQEDYVQKIESSSKSLLGIINDILDFSKIEAGKLTIENTDFDLETVFQDLSNIITYKAHEKRLEIVFGIDSKVPTYLNGDPLRLGQILTNLSNNAIKFTSEGEIVIGTKLVSEDEESVILQFSVKDSGVGIEQDKISGLFDSFTQADTSTSRKFGGTGLGLTISKNLAELMKGEIWAESEFGAGSTFIFTVELKKQKQSIKKLVPTKDLRGLKVLVVDDNEASREILTNALQSFTFNVTTVDSGQKAIDLLNTSIESPFELVLMDWNMPEMDGLTASELILKNTAIPKMPLIMMVTAYAKDEMYLRAEQIGLSSILTKPVRYSYLFDTIMNSFGKSVDRVSPMKSDLDEKSPELDGIRGAQILLVEDNETNQQVATELLESAGFFVSIANNGLEAVEQVNSSKLFDIVLMDLQMPEMNGYEATEEIRKNDLFKDLPVVAMTADAMQGVKERCLELGMNDFVTKPIDPAQLFSALIKWIKKGDRASLPMKVKEADELKVPEIEDVNTIEGLARVAGNKKLYLKLLRDFSTTKGNLITEIIELIDKNDIETAGRVLHTLKGTAGNLGMMDLHQETIEVEKEIKRNGWSNFVSSTTALSTKLSDLISKIKEAVLDEKEEITSQTFTPEKIALLSDLLHNDDPDAIEVFNAMGRIDHPHFEELKSKVNGYEFEEALEIISKMN
jgi:PAS domain S-box-containing protein